MMAGGVGLLDEQVSSSRRDLKHLDIIFRGCGGRKLDEKQEAIPMHIPRERPALQGGFTMGASKASAFG